MGLDFPSQGGDAKGSEQRNPLRVSKANEEIMTAAVSAAPRMRSVVPEVQ